MSNNLEAHYSNGFADQAVLIRLADADDGATMRRLAQLDTASGLDGACLIAERDGRPVAAAEIASGRLVADPFQPTADVVELLASRARSLRDGGSRASRLLSRRRLPAVAS